jgi:hypothetical protein
MPSPKNKALYNKVKNEAKRRFKVWPSAYASGWLVKEYKRRGGTYSGKKSSKEGIDRWFKEKWINVCKLPRVVPCGRPKTTLSTWKKKYPYCRPSRRVAGSTPRTSKELSKAEMQRRCKQKRRRPMKRVLGGRRVATRKGSRKGSRKRSRRRRY